MAGLRAEAQQGLPVADLAEMILDRSGYLAELQASTDLQDASRIENLNELVSVAREFDAQQPDGTLTDFLEQVSLVADADQIPDGENHGGVVTLMTLHTAKGLEFPVVFLTGMEERRLPPSALDDRRQGTRGGTPPRLRGHHPGPAAALPHPGGGPHLVGPARVPQAVQVPGRDPWPPHRVAARRAGGGRARGGAAGPAAGWPHARQPAGAVAQPGRQGDPRRVWARHGAVRRGPGDDPEAKIDFGGEYGIKHLVLRYAPIEKL